MVKKNRPFQSGDARAVGPVTTIPYYPSRAGTLAAPHRMFTRVRVFVRAGSRPRGCRNLAVYHLFRLAPTATVDPTFLPTTLPSIDAPNPLRFTIDYSRTKRAYNKIIRFSLWLTKKKKKQFMLKFNWPHIQSFQDTQKPKRLTKSQWSVSINQLEMNWSKGIQMTWMLNQIRRCYFCRINFTKWFLILWSRLYRYPERLKIFGFAEEDHQATFLKADV